MVVGGKSEIWPRPEKSGLRPEISLFGGDTLILAGRSKKPPDSLLPVDEEGRMDYI